MQYLVHVEHHPGAWWRLHLLGESVHVLGHELLVAVSNAGDAPVPIPFRWFKIKHIGKAWGTPEASKVFAAYAALKLGVLKTPFAVLEPNMVLTTPLPETDKQIAGQYLPDMRLPDLEIVQGYAALRTKTWFPAGEVYQFNNVDSSHFEGLLGSCRAVSEKYPNRRLTAAGVRNRHRVGIALGAVSLRLETDLREDYSTPLDDRDAEYNADAHVVNYERGRPPHFVPSVYGGRPTLATAPTPLQALLDVPERTQNRHLLWAKRVIRGLAARRPDYFKS